MIELLGYCSDPIIIDQLVEDAKALNDNYSNEYFASLCRAYCSPVMAKTIEENRKQLFAIQIKFIKQGKENSAALISSARESARSNTDNLEHNKQRPYLKSSWSPSAMR